MKYEILVTAIETYTAVREVEAENKEQALILAEKNWEKEDVDITDIKDTYDGREHSFEILGEEDQQKEKLFQLVHDNKYGVFICEFYSNKDCTNFIHESTVLCKEEEEIFKVLDIDFRADYSETIEINEVEPTNAPTINF
tara:strand:- start:462 stop:881 length:420 start_codon:yes stop_codon:yes gene_type:complete